MTDSKHEEKKQIEEQMQTTGQIEQSVEPGDAQENKEQAVGPQVGTGVAEKSAVAPATPPSQPHVVIDEEFKYLLPRPNDESRATLVADLRTNECRDALVVCRNTEGVDDDTLLDGYTRHAICIEFGIPYQITHMEFSSRAEAKYWIIQNQFERRNLNDFQKIEVGLKLKSVIAAQAKANCVAGEQGLANLPNPINTRDAIAKLVNVSSRQVGKVEIILDEGTEEQIQKARSGESSISAIYNEIRPSKSTERPESSAKSTSPPPESISATSPQGNSNDEQKPVDDSTKTNADKAKTTAHAEQATTTKKAITTFTELDELCQEGQFDGKKLRKASAKLQSAVDDLAEVNVTAAEMVEAGMVYHNLNVCIETLSKQGVNTDSLKKSLQVKLDQYTATHQKLAAMAKFIAEYQPMANALFEQCSKAEEQDVLTMIQEKFEENKAVFDEAMAFAQKRSVHILNGIDAPVPSGWFTFS